MPATYWFRRAPKGYPVPEKPEDCVAVATAGVATDTGRLDVVVAEPAAALETVEPPPPPPPQPVRAARTAAELDVRKKRLLMFNDEVSGSTTDASVGTKSLLKDELWLDGPDLKNRCCPSGSDGGVPANLSEMRHCSRRRPTRHPPGRLQT